MILSPLPSPDVEQSDCRLVPHPKKTCSKPWSPTSSKIAVIPYGISRLKHVVPVVALKSMVDHHFPHEKCHFCFIHDLQTSPNVDKVDVNNFPMKSHQETSISFRDFPWISHGFPMDFPWISKALRSVGTQQQRLSDAATTWVPGYPQ